MSRAFSPSPRTPRKPELMSPAGGLPQLRAAIEAGADAVFFGLDHFSARAKVGFTLESLPEIMAELHSRGVKGFVTFNTLIFDRELREAERNLLALSGAGVDALIVQDVGVARLAGEVVPQLEIHGSTQMSITSAEGAELSRRLGITRAVLGRELSLSNLEKIAGATDLELEVFVHGALCVSYSGQCFSSEAWGGRSANRGQCAQACRLPYDLMVDGLERDLGDAKYLLSPGDLYALHQIPDLVRIGIDCFKIEGRYKDADYVAAATRAYRNAIDEAWAGQPLSITRAEETDLEQVYSRGLGPWFMAGVNHQTVVQGRAPRHRGVKLGMVSRVGQSSVWARLEREVKPGDGLVFDAAHRRSLEQREEGGAVYEVFPAKNGEVELRFGNGQLEFGRVEAGDWVWRSSDPQLSQRYKALTEAKTPVYTRALNLKVWGRAGEVLTLEATDGNDFGNASSVTLYGQTALQPAQKRALDEVQLREHLGKLGGSPFHLGTLEATLEGSLFLPVSELNALRREAVEKLLELRKTPPERMGMEKLGQKLYSVSPPPPLPPSPPRLHLLVRTPDQLNAVLTLAPESITLDYLELYGLKPSVQKVKDAGIRCRVASPRILKPTEQNLQEFLLSLECEILVRSGGLLEGLIQSAAEGQSLPRLSGDFSLNTANVLTAQTYLELGCESITPTHDLNAAQIVELARWVGPQSLEPIVYQHLPVFHTEHCVFCRFLSSGTDYTNCGHPCESHQITLRDRQGKEHPVMADVGCRNTVFGGDAQSAGKHFTGWLETGIRDFRLEFVHESYEDVLTVTNAWSAALSGEIDPVQLERKLREVSRTVEGSLFVPLDFGALPALEMV